LAASAFAPLPFSVVVVVMDEVMFFVFQMESLHEIKLRTPKFRLHLEAGDNTAGKQHGGETTRRCVSM
jgi:hypothetical protein